MGRGVYRGGTYLLSAILAVLGVVIIVRTAIAGGTGLVEGYILGVGMLAVACMRLWILRK